MASTTSFDDWIGMGNEPDSHEDAYDLYHAALGEGLGGYEATERGSQLFIKGPSGDTLALVSEAARKEFLRYIEQFKGDGEMDWEGWIGYRRAIAKDD